MHTDPTIIHNQGRNRLIAAISSTLLLCVGTVSASGLSIGSGNTDKISGQNDETSYEVVTKTLSEQAAQSAAVTLKAAGIEPVSFETLNENTTTMSDYYILFLEASENGKPILKNGEDIILANVDHAGKVSFTSFEEDVLSEIPGSSSLEGQLISIKETNDIVRAQKLVSDVTGCEVPYCVSVTRGFLTELRGNLEDARSLPTIAQVQQDSAPSEEEAGGRANEFDESAQQTIIDDTLWYNQNDYKGFYYQDSYDIPTYGCGLCATSVALDMLFDVDWDPIYVARHMESWADENGHKQYCVSAGTAYDPWMKTVQGAFEVKITRASSIAEVKQALMDGKMVVSGNGGSAFLNNKGKHCYYDGHIICFYKTDGNTVWAKDSSGSGGASVRYSAANFEQWWNTAAFRTFIFERVNHNQTEPIIAIDDHPELDAIADIPDIETVENASNEEVVENVPEAPESLEPPPKDDLPIVNYPV